MNKRFDYEIYVACLSSYVAGTLHGCWIDAAQDESDIEADIKKMLADSPENTKDNPCEEWAIHGDCGFGSIEIAENENLERVSQLALALESTNGVDKNAYSKFVTIAYNDDFSLDAFHDRYIGEFESEEAYGI